MLSHDGLASFPLKDEAAFIRRLRMGGVELHEEALAVLERLKARMHVLRDASSLPPTVGRPSIPEKSTSSYHSTSMINHVHAEGAAPSSDLDKTTSKSNAKLISPTSNLDSHISDVNLEPLAMLAQTTDTNYQGTKSHSSSVLTTLPSAVNNVCGHPSIPSPIIDDLLIQILQTTWSK